MDKIKVQGLTKQFGDIIAVDDVDASFTEGNYTMILGPSGSGKSTLLRMIAGLESPTSGAVYIDGDDVTARPSRERGLSMVFQNLALWDHKTVRENMAFGLKMEGVDAADRRERVREIADLLEIEDKLDASPDQLSGGQQQRVALGRSLVREPEVILLDEPLSSLDQRLRLRMRTELRRIQQETGISFIHVTHNQEDAMTVADEILVINEGRIEQFDRPLDLYHTPANEFVADFIGSPSMNLFDAEFDAAAGTFALSDGCQIAVPDDWRDHFRERVDSGPVRLGIRPEALTVVDDTDSVSLEGKCTIVETFGDYNWYYLETEFGEEIVVQSNDESVIQSLSPGDAVTVAASPDSLHTFSPETGESFDTALLSEGRRISDEQITR